jgi:hypothetical protein
MSMRRLVCLLFAAGASLSTASAQNNFSFEGLFLSDDQVQLFSFTLASAETVSFQTFGYGGGTNSADQVVPPGGFESLLTWFEPDGTYIDNSLTCGSGKSYLDACLDAYGQVPLAAGTYTLALTQSGNGPVTGPNCAFPDGNLSCGFTQQGSGNYTPLTTQDPGCTEFCGTFGSLESGNWAVDILNVSSASISTATPEPATMLLAGCSLALLGLAKRRRREERHNKR